MAGSSPRAPARRRRAGGGEHAARLETTRARILEAAERRIAGTGCRRTSLAAIAADAGMSTANLYRYFDGKQTLIAACAERILAERIEYLERQLWAPASSAGERLRKVIAALHAHTRALLNERPGVAELIELMVAERPDLVRRARQAEQLVIEWAIRDGLRRGEFTGGEPRALAAAVHAALGVLRIPQALRLLEADRAAEMEAAISTLCLRALRSDRPA